MHKYQGKDLSVIKILSINIKISIAFAKYVKKPTILQADWFSL